MAHPAIPRATPPGTALHANGETRAPRNVGGVVCGHIHHAEIVSCGNVLYCNDGDWVDSCTALIEHRDGTLELVRWTENPAIVKSDDPAESVPV